jgi:dihydropyrimidinase
MSPPFRNKKHQDSLWAGLQSGRCRWWRPTIAPLPRAEALRPRQLLQDPERDGGLEDRMPMLWTHGVGTGRLTPNEFVAVTSTNIAKILNCYPKKGAVLVGADADLVVWDPEKEKTITAGKPAVGHRLQRLRGPEGEGPAALHPDPRPCGGARRRGADEGGPRPVRRREARPAVNRALSQWKDLTAPRPVVRTGNSSGDGGVECSRSPQYITECPAIW